MRRSHHKNAFTLIELLVSVGIALLLVLGINTVFKVTSQTVGSGNSVLTAERDGRTSFYTFFNDTNCVDAVPAAGSTNGDAPFLVITSQQIYAFRNATDQQGASNPTTPQLDTNLYAHFTSPGIPVAMINNRSHRIDRLLFFARGLYNRQTTDNGADFVANGTGAEALIWIGHAMQPVKAGVAWNDATETWLGPADASAPSATANPNNYFSSDWMLARMALVMKTSGSFSSSYYIPDNTGLAPFNFGGANGTPASLAPTTDLVGTSISIYNSMNYYIAPTTTTGVGTFKPRTGGIQSYSWTPDPTNTTNPAHHANYGADWWDPVSNYRYQASPFVLSGTAIPKISSANLALCMPSMIRGCSSFVVEYAANNYTKDPIRNDGTPAANQTVPTPDPTGQVDYFIPTGGTNRQIRWYGFPRWTSGALTGSGLPSINMNNGDVVPWSDVMNSYGWTNLKETDGSTANYADAERLTGFTSASDYSSMPKGQTYMAAWGPDVRHQPFPKMIRITIEIDDHDGRMTSPQRFEFIYDVQE